MAPTGALCNHKEALCLGFVNFDDAAIAKIGSGSKTCDGTVGGPSLKGNQQPKAVNRLVWQFPTIFIV